MTPFFVSCPVGGLSCEYLPRPFWGEVAYVRNPCLAPLWRGVMRSMTERVFYKNLIFVSIALV